MKKTVQKINQKYLTEKKFGIFENTFEKSMQSVAKSFARVDNALELHSKILQDILKEIRQIHEDNKYFRASMSNFNTDNISRDRRIDSLDVRVEDIELKLK